MDLLIWQMRKNCSLFITSGTLSQLTGNISICNTSKKDFRRLEVLSCGVWPSPDFSLLSSRISLQNRKKCRFEPTFKKACPARLSGRKSLISSGFRRVRGLQKRPQNGHPRHSCIKDSKSVEPRGSVGSNPTRSARCKRTPIGCPFVFLRESGALHKIAVHFPAYIIYNIS